MSPTQEIAERCPHLAEQHVRARAVRERGERREALVKAREEGQQRTRRVAVSLPASTIEEPCKVPRNRLRARRALVDEREKLLLALRVGLLLKHHDERVASIEVEHPGAQVLVRGVRSVGVLCGREACRELRGHGSLRDDASCLRSVGVWGVRMGGEDG